MCLMRRLKLVPKRFKRFFFFFLACQFFFSNFSRRFFFCKNYLKLTTINFGGWGMDDFLSNFLEGCSYSLSPIVAVQNCFDVNFLTASGLDLFLSLTDMCLTANQSVL